MAQDVKWQKGAKSDKVSNIMDGNMKESILLMCIFHNMATFRLNKY